MLWNTPKMWDGETCYILGGGTSVVKQFNIPENVVRDVYKGIITPKAYLPYFSPLKGKLVIGINKAYEFGELLDILFWGDPGFWEKYKKDILHFEGLRITCMNGGHIKGVKFLLKNPNKKYGLTLNDNSVISFNLNSGAAAINLAVHLGAKRIILLGFDMNLDAKKNQHWHKFYATDKKKVQSTFEKQMVGFNQIQIDAKEAGVEILNANPESAIDCFKKVNLIDILPKKLNILITNNHLDLYAGSETFTLTIYDELIRRGHNVDVLTFIKGDLSKRMKITSELKAEYDLILINHNTCLERVKDIKGFKIFTSHGTMPALEQPVKGADAYVSISDEVQQYIYKKGFKSTLILNGIDCNRFNPTTSINKKAKTVLSLAKTKQANDTIRKACQIAGLKFTSVKGKYNIEEDINKADIVVTLGRGALEAMACGRAVVVFDARAYMGLIGKGDGIIDNNHNELVKFNFSGRATNQQMNAEELAKEFMKYEQRMGIENLTFALENVDVANQIDKYLKLYYDRTDNSNRE